METAHVLTTWACSHPTVRTSVSSSERHLSVYPAYSRTMDPPTRRVLLDESSRKQGFEIPPSHHHLKPAMIERPGNDGDHPVSKSCQEKFMYLFLFLNSKRWKPTPFPSDPTREWPWEVGSGLWCWEVGGGGGD